MATPGFRALRAGFPSARITLQVRAGLEALVSGSPWFDRVMVLRGGGGGPRAAARRALSLRPERYDLGLCLPDSFSSALGLRLAGARVVVGYAGAFRGPLVTVRVPRPGGPGASRIVPREAHVLGLVQALGCPSRGTHLELFVTDDEARRADRHLREAGLGEAPFGVLAPGATYGPAKCWPPERFAAVGDALASQGLSVVLVGAPAEASRTRRVASAMRSPAVDLAGAIDLGTLKAVVRRSRLLVGNDAGSRHVAVALGIPAVVVFGPTSLEKTSWNLDRVRVVASEVRCRPCYHRRCPVDHRCMVRLPPRRVVEAVRHVLAATGDGP